MAPPAPTQRFTDLLDQVRAEYDSQAGRAHEYESQSKFNALADGFDNFIVTSVSDTGKYAIARSFLLPASDTVSAFTCFASC